MLADDEGFAFAGDPAAQYLPKLVIEGTIELIKTRDSAFLHTELEERLIAWNVRRMVLAGVSTHTCIAATAADAYALNIDVLLVDDATASHLPYTHRPVLDMLQNEYRQKVEATAGVEFHG